MPYPLQLGFEKAVISVQPVHHSFVMKTKSIALLTAFGLLLAASSVSASPRVWKDASSGRTLTGEFVELTKDAVKAVSYTHLTLPTNRIV